MSTDTPSRVISMGARDVRVIAGLYVFLPFALLVSVYLSARPILYYDPSYYRQAAIFIVKNRINIPDGKVDASFFDNAQKIINSPVSTWVGPFATVKVPVTIGSEVNTRPSAEYYVRGKDWSPDAYLVANTDLPRLQYNWDLIIVAAGAAVVLAVALWYLRKPQSMAAGNSVAEQQDEEAERKAGIASGILRENVRHAMLTSDQMFYRSTLLLVGGVVMAFVGLLVFFVSSLFLDSTGEGGHLVTGIMSDRQILSIIRSFSMLIFIEAIAWFLLRQYRTLVEDYKSFYKYYMRRANYLAALAIATEKADTKAYAKIVESLLTEDLTGRLKKDETTEALEAVRLIDPNFASALTVGALEVARDRIKTVMEKLGEEDKHKLIGHHP